ncbi:MAG: tetratricopeptide repeat protein [Nannocystis sp.]|nr:tetratricopeptide repeat protein [Nannocystis sp.]
MVDHDDRVRVMDFGLAHGRLATAALPTVPDLEPGTDSASRSDLAVLSARLTRVGAVQGTPAYMAPEQWEGREAEAAADQFGWCVMAWELLYGERPFVGATLLKLRAEVLAGHRRPPPRGRGVPRWLHRVLVRGLATAPAQRWPDLAALLTALDRGRSRARLKLVALGLAVVTLAALAVLAARRIDHAQRVAACEQTGAAIDEVWNDAARERLRAAFLASGVAQAAITVDKLLPWFDRHASAWKTARIQVCGHAELARDWDPATQGRALWCLDDRRSSLVAQLRQLAVVDATAVHRAVPTAAAVPVDDRCTDPNWLLRQPSPPTQRRDEIAATREALALATSLAATGKYSDAVAAAVAARTRAETLAWPPLLAAARNVEGHALAASGAYAAAETTLAGAYFLAAREGAWTVASDAASELIHVVGYNLARPPEARAWFRHAEVAAAHAGDPVGLVAAARLEHLGTALDLAGDYAEADGLYRESLALRERALGPAHLAVALGLNNLGALLLATGDNAEARTVLERALEIRTEALGPEHPDLAQSLGNLASVHVALGDYATARTLHERALAIKQQTLGANHPAVANTINNLALVHYHTGAFTDARALHERALAIREQALAADHPAVGDSLVNLAVIDRALGDDAAARARYERAIPIFAAALGPDHPDLADALNNLATLLAITDPAQARRLNERALAIREKALGPDHRLVADSLANLANLELHRGATGPARALLERARKIKEQALGPDHPDLALTLKDLARVDLAEHHPHDALPRLERALTIFAAQPGDQHGELEAHFELARALLASNGDRARAIAAATHARDGWRASDQKLALAEVDAWLAANSR